MASDDLYSEMGDILAAVAHRIDVSTDDADLILLHSNAIFALPRAGLVIRVATNPHALERVATSLRITRWLAERGFPCVAPAAVEGQPWVERGRVVSVWRHLSLVEKPTPTGSELGHVLALLHEQPTPPDPPEQLSDPLDSVSQALHGRSHNLSAADSAWLADRIDRLRTKWRTLEFPRPSGLVHGDAHPGNLMRTSSGRVVLGDWDHVAIGPPEWDLVQVHYTRRRFGYPSDQEIEDMSRVYGWDLRDWPDGMAVLLAIREVTGLSPYLRNAHVKPFLATELVHRVDTLRRNDTTARWNRPPNE